MAPKVTTELLRQLRQTMKNAKYVPESIQAYIVPSGDAHQVWDLVGMFSVNGTSLKNTPKMKILKASLFYVHIIVSLV